MSLKGWWVEPFNPEQIVLNASSRVIQYDMDNSVPRYRLEADREKVEFYWSLDNKYPFEWVTFTNTGKYPLYNLRISFREPFNVIGGIPSTLRPGESFKVRVNFSPDEPRKYTSFLWVQNDDLIFKLPLIGMWEFACLRYDGTATHNGDYLYSASCSEDNGDNEDIEFAFDDSEFYDGKYTYTGVKSNGN